MIGFPDLEVKTWHVYNYIQYGQSQSVVYYITQWEILGDNREVKPLPT